jgi:hypothetical protein
VDDAGGAGGRRPALIDDACEALRLAGEPFSASAIRDHPRENANDYARFPALYRPDVAARLAEPERQTIERFYADDPVPARLIPRDHEDRRSPASKRGEPREAAENLSLRREARRVRAFELSRVAQTRLESELEQAQTERDRSRARTEPAAAQSPRALHAHAARRLLPSTPPVPALQRSGSDPT